VGKESIQYYILQRIKRLNNPKAVIPIIYHVLWATHFVKGKKRFCRNKDSCICGDWTAKCRLKHCKKCQQLNIKKWKKLYSYCGI